MIGTCNDNSRDFCRFGELAQLRIRQRNRINNTEAGTGEDRAGEEVSFYGGIVGLPDPKAGQKLMEIGNNHAGSVPERDGLGKVVAL
jgi:hypothetical protein